MGIKYGIFILSTLIVIGSSSDDQVYRLKRDKFDWGLFNKISETKNDDNIIISPISVKIALKLLEVAAVGRTKDQLTQALADFKSGDSWYKEVISSLERESKHYKLNMGTKFYLDKTLNSPTDEFLNIANKTFHSSLERLDFTESAETANIINKWISEITVGNIKDMVKEDDVKHSHAILANVIYFKGKWETEFFVEDTEKLKFTLSNGEVIKVPTMAQLESYLFLETNAFGQQTKLLRMPFKGGKFAMTFILPNKVNGLDNVLANITPGKISVLQNGFEYKQVVVRIPKFEFYTRSKLNKPIKELKVIDIFTNSATLPGLGNFKVDEILQEAGIKLNEAGTEVYAATIEKFYELSDDYDIEPPIHFFADHPFAFFIEDESTGALLFVGKVTNPSKK